MERLFEAVEPGSQLELPLALASVVFQSLWSKLLQVLEMEAAVAVAAVAAFVDAVAILAVVSVAVAAALAVAA